MNENKKIYILSSRSGGPFSQWCKIGEELKRRGFEVRLENNFKGWIKAHFIYGNKILMTNVPLLFRLTPKNFVLNIKGNYRKERNLIRNPLAYLYDFNKMWCQNVIVPSQYLKDILKLKNATIIPNGINLDKKNIIKNVGKTNNFKLITISKFFFKEKAEGVVKLAKIISSLKTKKNIVLEIYGYGTLENEIKLKIKKIKTPNNISIKFKGRTHNPKGVMKKSNIFLYWSDLDVMPNVFLEALSCGLPIVANDFPSFKEILGNHNFLAKNEKEFAYFVNRLIDSPRLIKEIKNKNLKYIEKFNIKKIVDKWIDIIS